MQVRTATCVDGGYRQIRLVELRSEPIIGLEQLMERGHGASSFPSRGDRFLVYRSIGTPTSEPYSVQLPS